MNKIKAEIMQIHWTDKDLLYILKLSAPDMHTEHDDSECMYCLCKAEAERRNININEAVSVINLMEWLDSHMK